MVPEIEIKQTINTPHVYKTHEIENKICETHEIKKKICRTREKLPWD